MRKKNEIVLIGPFPPPYGGISVHLQRLYGYLAKTDFKYLLYNTFSKSESYDNVISVQKVKYIWFFYFLFFCNSIVYHLHSPNWFLRFLFSIMARFRSGKFVISIQGRSINEAIENKNFIKRKLTTWMLKEMDAVIACNEEIRNQCIERIGLPREKVHLIPAYIPPLPDDIKRPKGYINQFIRNHSPVICATGWIGQVYKNTDIYGIDMLIELVEKLLKDFPDIGLILSVNGGESEQLINQTIGKSKKIVGNHIFFITEQLDDVVGIYKNCDLFCRPTNTDGDAVSIREAIHVGTPVVASDIVTRPSACILFESRNTVKFEIAVRQTLENLDFFAS
jgi:glycosyltransferase involved in cell wall biosynthesis